MNSKDLSTLGILIIGLLLLLFIFTSLPMVIFLILLNGRNAEIGYPVYLYPPAIYASFFVIWEMECRIYLAIRDEDEPLEAESIDQTIDGARIINSLAHAALIITSIAYIVLSAAFVHHGEICAAAALLGIVMATALDDFNCCRDFPLAIRQKGSKGMLALMIAGCAFLSAVMAIVIVACVAPEIMRYL